jgi:hypothetical protein
VGLVKVASGPTVGGLRALHIDFAAARDGWVFILSALAARLASDVVRAVACRMLPLAFGALRQAQLALRHAVRVAVVELPFAALDAHVLLSVVRLAFAAHERGCCRRVSVRD